MDRINIMQSQNFEFLKDTWPELAALAGFAEHYSNIDPQSALTKLRNFAERSVSIVYSELGLPRPPQANFMEQLSNAAFEAVTPKVVIDKLHALRIHGNKAAHGDKVSEQSAQWLLKESFDIARWLFITYANGDLANIADYQAIEATQSIEQNPIIQADTKYLMFWTWRWKATMLCVTLDYQNIRSVFPLCATPIQIT